MKNSFNQFFNNKFYSNLSVFISLLLTFSGCSISGYGEDLNFSTPVSNHGHCIKSQGFNWSEISPENEIPQSEDDHWYNAYLVNQGQYVMELDSNVDGFVSRDEFVADSNPLWGDKNRNIVAVSVEGFDCYYNAQTGLISDDDLLDVLILDPSERIVPAMRAIVLIQQDSKNFSVEDASGYKMPQNLLNIDHHVVITEINGDFSRDLILQNLSDLIPGAMDLIVYGYERLGSGFYRSMPNKMYHLNPESVAFFTQLSEWIEDANYFDKLSEDGYDVSDINMDAYQLAVGLFQEILESGELQYPTESSRSVSNVVSSHLGINIFYGNLNGCADGVISFIGNSTANTGIARDILEVLGFIRRHLVSSGSCP